MGLQEVTFSDLLQRSNETVEKLKQSRARALRVRRRGVEEDLILTTASKAEQDEVVVNLAIRLLGAIAGDPVLRSKHLLDVLPQVFPWIRFLPTDEKIEFVRDFIEVMGAGAEFGNPAPVVQLITEWRNTAEVYADPELLRVLSSQIVEDGGAVSPPAPPT
ncbi:hypothetical protein [Kribbella solani]|uniref:Uncharacterized protein n=1 Tax=Kribbella solani TaxID=236067 RepID=A0A841DKJ3_9ACTN|nr:hypothetical protein [Kribbella solani]MBB5979133.1 hypothetical protein [Kribbella solani]